MTNVKPTTWRRLPAALWPGLGVLCACALMLTGCGVTESPPFVLNMEGRKDEDLSLAQREAIVDALADMFGTPNEPKAPQAAELDMRLVEVAAGEIGRDRDGKLRGLFRQHCAPCHGITGDGAGSLATTFDPYPRDFRAATFKYTSTLPGSMPTRGDLERTLLRGIPGTGMPAFPYLPSEEIDALLEYVKYLSIRGQAESYLFDLVVNENEPLPLGVMTMEMVENDAVAWTALRWREPNESPELHVVTPPPMPAWDTPEDLAESIARGREIFLSKDAQCASCHGEDGRGRGENDELYDDWNKPKYGVNEAATAELAPLFTLPAQKLKPRDFHEAVFHGGSNPRDLYLRIAIGIKGTPMPPAGPSPGSEGILEPDEIWDLVNYVRSLSESADKILQTP